MGLNYVSGFQPLNIELIPNLGRCPRLVWGRAFGPVYSHAEHGDEGIIDRAFSP